MTLSKVVIVGGSIAAVTAASTLRLEGYDRDIVILSEEHHAPYSRVPLSKGIIDGSLPAESVFLPPLADDIEVRTGARARALDPRERSVVLADGSSVAYDGLIIATGCRARRLAPVEVGELTLRDLDDAEAVGAAARGARTAVVVGGGFLAMEIASTLMALGLQVTLVSRGQPLLRTLGPWLSSYILERALEKGLRVEMVPEVQLVGAPPVAAAFPAGRVDADVVVTAVGDLPNVEWLAGSGLPIAGGVHVDAHGLVAPGIVAAGDVVATPGVERGRTPHWTNAVEQAQLAARTLLGIATAEYSPEAYYWTEQFGIDLKMSGHPQMGAPDILEGDPATGSALLRWNGDPRPTAVAINHRMPIVRLKKLGWRAAPDLAVATDIH